MVLKNTASRTVAEVARALEAEATSDEAQARALGETAAAELRRAGAGTYLPAV